MFKTAPLPVAPRNPALPAEPLGRALDSAASIAFWFFLSVVPLLVLLGYFVGQVARARGVDVLVEPLLDIVPRDAERLIRKEIDRLSGSGASSVAPVGVAGYLWTASSGLHNLMRVFEGAAGVPRRPWWRARAIAVAWVVVGILVACLLAWVLVELHFALRGAHTGAHALARAARTPAPAGAHKIRETAIEQILGAGLMLGTGMMLLAGFYRFAVDQPSRVRRRVWPGTITAVTCWFAVSWAFGLYVVSIGSYAIYYGGLAAVAVLLLWLYLTSLSLVAGAEVNAYLEKRTRRQLPFRASKRATDSGFPPR